MTKSIGPVYVNDDAAKAARYVRERTDLGGLDPKFMLVLGSGCGDIAESISSDFEIGYGDIPNMPGSSVHGHKGALKVGRYHGVPVLGFQGRNHCYEGNSAHDASFMVYLAHHLGARVSIMTTAAGIAPDFDKSLEDDVRHPHPPGTVFRVRSVFPNYLESSLRGPIGDVGQRFNGMLDSPSIYLGCLAKQVASASGLALPDCIYVPRPGPNYETPLEVSMLSHLAKIADLPVLGGMSVLPELEVANMLGMKSLVIGIGTNQMFDLRAQAKVEEDLLVAAGDFLENGDAKYSLSEANAFLRHSVDTNQPSHEEVKETAGSSDVTERLDTIIGGLIKSFRF